MMDILSALGLLGPMIRKGLLWLWERVVVNWKSTATWTAYGGIVAETLNIFGCDTTLFNPAMMGVLAALPGLLGTDRDKLAPTLLKTMREAVEEARTK